MEVGKLLGRKVPLKVAVGAVVLLPILGYFIGQIGGSPGRATSALDATVNTRILASESFAETRMVTVVIKNPNDYGVRVASISASSSKATPNGCPAGFLTTEAVDDPSGYIKANGIRAYQLTVKTPIKSDDRCQNQELVLPLTVELESSGG